MDLLNPTPQAEARKHKLKVYRPENARVRDRNAHSISRLSFQHPGLSSWTSSAPAVSQSPLFSRTLRRSLYAKVARLSSANRTHPPLRDVKVSFGWSKANDTEGLVVRHVSPRAARLEESRWIHHVRETMCLYSGIEDGISCFLGVPDILPDARCIKNNDYTGHTVFDILQSTKLPNQLESPPWCMKHKLLHGLHR